MDQFNQDFEINFLPDDNFQFTFEEKQQLIRVTQQAVYSMSRVDSYFDKPLPWTEGQSYYNWLKNSITKIQFKPNPNALNTGGGGSINLKGNIILNNVDAYDEWFDPSGGVAMLSQIGIITHETRHNNGIGHASCKGSNNMDENLRSRGAHGLNVILRHWMKHLLPPEIVQSDSSHVFDYLLFLERMCSFDDVTEILEQEDLDWIEEVSGHPLTI